MNYTKTYDYSNNIIPYGYKYFKSSSSEISLSDLVNSVVQNIIVYDTENDIMNEFLVVAQDLLNNKDKLVIGLTSNEIIKSLKTKGVNSGFFRSTSEKSNIAIIIVDKKKFYLAFDENHIYETNSGNNSLVFNYINHLIWSKSEFEYCQGRLSEVKSTRLSIVKPIFNQNMESQFSYSTKDLNCDSYLKTKEDNTNEDSLVMHNLTKSAYLVNDTLYLQTLENQYLPINNWQSLIKSQSFKNNTFKDLSNDKLWVDGKNVTIKQSDTIVKKYEKPLNEYKIFQPDFDDIAGEYTDYTLSLIVDVEVEPITLNSNYKLSDSYKKIDNVKNTLNNYLEELDKLIDDKDAKKQLKTIMSERNLEEQVRLYNLFIADKEFGVDSLNTKTKFKSISFDKKWNVPSDIIGKLYTKGSVTYLAMKDESHIDDATKWLEQNEIRAILIKDNGKEN